MSFNSLVQWGAFPFGNALLKTPKPAETPSASMTSTESKDASARAMELRRRRGRASTILSGADTSQTGTTGTSGSKQLLGT